MVKESPKLVKKGAVKRLRDLYEKNRGKASKELLDILKAPKTEDAIEKKSALPDVKNEAEL